jgi:hypothetical protein
VPVNFAECIAGRGVIQPAKFGGLKRIQAFHNEALCCQQVRAIAGVVEPQFGELASLVSYRR